jgi:hypothetical protein
MSIEAPRHNKPLDGDAARIRHRRRPVKGIFNVWLETLRLSYHGPCTARTRFLIDSTYVLCERYFSREVSWLRLEIPNLV